MKITTIALGAMLTAVYATTSTVLAGDRPRGAARHVSAGAAIAGAVASHVVHGPSTPPPGRTLPPPPRPPPGEYEMMPPPGEFAMMPPPGPVPPALFGVMEKVARIERMSRVVSDRATARMAPIIVQLEDGRRLYQPAVHGHTAFIQVWSSVHNDWISIQEHPSIW